MAERDILTRILATKTREIAAAKASRPYAGMRADAEAAPPPEAVFSAPTQDESDVPLTTSVRIQFSRDLDASTIKGHVRIGYLQAQTAERGEFDTPEPRHSAADLRSARDSSPLRGGRRGVSFGINRS